MRLGINLGLRGAEPGLAAALVDRAEQLGLDSVWVGEAYGADAVSVLGFLAARTERVGLGSAVLQLSARTPAATAMAAMTLDALSGGRFRLGLGASGPQVVEGWHGQPFGDPLGRTREHVAIVRRIVARDAPVAFAGQHHRLPYDGADASGLGKPLRSSLRPVRRRIPTYLAALGPRNVRLAGEIADGWLPFLLSPEHDAGLFDELDRGLAAAGRSPEEVDVAPTVLLAAGDDVAACRDRLRPTIALYVGGMGSRGRNFYRDALARAGHEGAADRIQEHYLAGRPREAAASVPDSVIDELALVGPADRIADRLAAWRESRATTLLVSTDQPDALDALVDA